MKTLILILTFILLALSASGGVKMIGRDFWVTDKDLRPVTFGVCSWTDEDVDFQLAGFINISLLNFWDNHLRFGAGMAFTKPDEGLSSPVDMRLMVPTISTLFFDHLELGFYVSPFYNLYDGGINDPYGVMIGYAFGF